MKIPSPLALALLLLALALPASAATGVLGDWKTTTGSIVRVEPCGAAVCLKIVQLSPTAPERTDKQNPTASLRNRALCGLTIGTGFHRNSPDHLSEGRLYDPKSGHTYSGEITANGADLKLHGYIGVPLFGRTETWHRAASGAAACR